MRNIPVIFVFWLFFSLSCFANSSQKVKTDSVTGIKSWEINSQGVNFSLTQILPDQARAFYVNRGFTLEQAELFASSCVYMTIMRNDSAPGTVHVIKNNWSVLFNKLPHPLVSVETWMKRLKNRKVKNSALLAFRWAQFPIEQKFEPDGDWNQGMLSIGLPPGSSFDLIVRWDISGKAYKTKLLGVQCAK